MIETPIIINQVTGEGRLFMHLRMGDTDHLTFITFDELGEATVSGIGFAEGGKDLLKKLLYESQT